MFMSIISIDYKKCICSSLPEIRVVCREFLAFKYVFIVFFETNQTIIYIYTWEVLKTGVKTRFFNTQYPFDLCGCRKRILNGYCVVEKQM